MDDIDRRDRLRARCTELYGHGRINPATWLSQLSAAGPIERDTYGEGGVVEELEAEVAELLGKPAAVLMPSGTMAQQIALRIHADTSGRTTVLCHPQSHIAIHERDAVERMHGLDLRRVGGHLQALSVAEVEGVAEPVAALLIELPERELGGPLLGLAELDALRRWADRTGAALHMDGARLWDCGPAFGSEYAAVAARFDTVYVSLYKLLGGMFGALLAGEGDVIAQAREWRHRHGGTLYAMWPIAASGLVGLRERLPKVGEYVAHARAIAAELRGDDDIQVRHDPPQTPLMHLALRASQRDLQGQVVRLAATEGRGTLWFTRSTEVPGWRMTELTVGDATMQHSAAQIAADLRTLVTPLPSGSPAEELVEVIDADGGIIDVVTRQRMRADGLRHRCTYVVVVTFDDQVVVHQRAKDKDVYPGWWDIAFGGVCDVGEDWATSAARELQEEAGISGVELEELGEVTWSASDASLRGRVFLARHDGPVTPVDGEVVSVDRVAVADLASWVAERDVCSDSADVVLPVLLDAVNRLSDRE